jgi:hypothetical protein
MNNVPSVSVCFSMANHVFAKRPLGNLPSSQWFLTLASETPCQIKEIVLFSDIFRV